MSKQHLLSKDSAQAVGDEHDFSMFPDSLLLQSFVKNLSELLSRQLAVHGRRWILRNHDVRFLEMRVSLNELRPIRTI